MSILRNETSIKGLYGNELILSWRLISQNYTNNTSKVYFEAKFIAGEGGVYTTFPYEYDIYRQINSNNQVELVHGEFDAEVSPVRIGVDEGEEYILMAETFDIEHYGANKDEGITFDYKLPSMRAANGKSALTCKLVDTIPRTTSTVDLHAVSNFNDEDNNLVVEYAVNSAANYQKVQMALSVSIDPTPIINYRDVPIDDSMYRFTFTETEINRLCEATPGTSRDFYIAVRATKQNGNVEHILYAEKYCKTTFSIKTTAPVIHSVEIEDVNPITLALTGNKNVFVDNYTEVGYDINASGAKGATIAKYKVQYWNDETSDDGILGLDWAVLDGATGTFTYHPIPKKGYENIMTFMVEDTRGFVSSNKLLTLNRVNYDPLTCDHFEVRIGMSDDDNTKGVVNIVIGGRFWRGNFGAKANTIKVEIRMDTNGEQGEWADITPLLSEVGSGRYSLSFRGTGLDHNKIYTFQARITDELEVVETKEETVRITPVFDWGENDFRFNKPVNFVDGLTANAITADIIKPKLLNAETVAINDYAIGDFVWQTGDDGNYAYRKWASGKLEAWRTANSTITANATQKYGSTYYTPDLTVSTTGDASQFIEVDNVQMTINRNGTIGMWIPVVKKWEVDTEGKATITYSLFEPTNLTGAAVMPCVYIIGRWK